MVASYPIANKEPQAHYLGGLIENARRAGVKIKLMLLDRGLNCAANMLEVAKIKVSLGTALIKR